MDTLIQELIELKKEYDKLIEDINDLTKTTNTNWDLYHFKKNRFNEVGKLISKQIDNIKEIFEGEL